MDSTDLKEYDTIFEGKYRVALDELQKDIKEGTGYIYKPEDYEVSFDNMALLAFPQTDITITATTLSTQEMFDDLLALKRAAIIYNKTRDDYYAEMANNIDIENNYLDKRLAFFRKAMNKLDVKKKLNEES